MPEPSAGFDRDRDRSLIARGLGWSTIGYPANVALLFLAQVLVARLVDPEGFGTYAIAVSVVTLGALVAQLGIPQSLLRRASAALTGEHDTVARHEIISALVIAAIAASIAATVVGSPAGAAALDALFSGTAIASIAVLVGCRLGLKVLENLVPEIFRAFRDYMRATLFDSLLANLGVAAILAGVLVTGTTIDLNGVMLVTVVVSAAALVPALVSIAAKIRALRASGFTMRNPVEPAMWAATIGRAVIAQLDLLVVGALGTGSEVALYAAPFRLALLVGLPLIAVNQVVTPLIAGWYATGERRRLETALQGTAGLATVVAAVLALGLVVGGEPVLTRLFGEQYADGYSVLVILVVGQVVQTWTGSCGFAMMMTGHHRVYAAVLTASGVLTLGLDVALFEVWGIEGVALATAVMLVAQNVVNMVYLRRRAGIRTVADVRLVASEVRDLRSRFRA